jgi:hypothetical protein
MSSIGEIDGLLPIERAVSAMAGFYDLAAVSISASTDEDIDLYSAIGTGCVGVDILDTGGVDGNVLIKGKGTVYVSVPIFAYSRTGILPRFRYIKKTGSVSSVVVLYQKLES